MASVIDDMLSGRAANYLLPFLWLKGEAESVLREEIARIDGAGIKAICLESRPHPDFCGPLWWRDLDIIMDEARTRGMRVWVLDDAHFPTGYARGWVRDQFPELRKLLLAQRHVDVLGPLPGAAILMRDGMRPDHGLVRHDERLISVIASRRGEGQSVDDTLVDITHLVQGNRLWWDVPAGSWRIFFMVETRHGGNLPDYLNPIDPQACRVLIDAVYEPHYARYAQDFGGTFAGFFSDEPSIANSGSYEDTIGRQAGVLPWCPDMLAQLAESFGGPVERYLPGLWCDIGAKTWAIRYAFMDLVSRLYSTSFGEQLGAWCRKHGVEYIGHVIEDNNVHARLGGGVGHYHRALAGQDMAGLDVVLWQIRPGHGEESFSWIAGEADGEFFHFGLAKMATSLGHLDPRKKGRTLCEMIGAYGWSAGLRLMTWIANHMLVRGVNVFVPHSFSMAPFPDTDCPPHFFVHGQNPQFRYFGIWAGYVNRMCHLLQGGQHIATAAVVYHAEAEWSGACMLFQKPVRALMQHQIDCDVIPLDDLVGKSEVINGRLHIHHEDFSCLVVPYAQRLPMATLERILAHLHAGLPTYFVDGLPEAASQDVDAHEILDALAHHPRCHISTLESIAKDLRRDGHGDITVTGAHPHLRHYHYRTAEGQDVLMLFNEDPVHPIHTTITTAIAGPVSGYDSFANTLVATTFTTEAQGTQVSIHLEPGEAQVLLFGGRTIASAPVANITMADLTGPWEVSLATSADHPRFTPWRKLDNLVNLHAPDLLPDFTGTIRYTCTFTAPVEVGHVGLDLGAVFEVAEVTINGNVLPAKIAPPYTFDLTGLVQPGVNQLTIDVTNTLVNQVQDWFSQFHQLDPTGLLGPVRLSSAQ